MMTFHIIEATQLHGRIDAELFEDSVHKGYRFISEESNMCAKTATKSDYSLDTGSVSDDAFISSKPLYVYFIYCDRDSHICIAYDTSLSLRSLKS